MARVFQQLPDEATVLVWKNARVFKILRGGHVGHAAIMLRNNMLPATIQAKEEEAGKRGMELRQASKAIGQDKADLQKSISKLVPWQ